MADDNAGSVERLVQQQNEDSGSQSRVLQSLLAQQKASNDALTRAMEQIAASIGDLSKKIEGVEAATRESGAKAEQAMQSAMSPADGTGGQPAGTGQDAILEQILDAMKAQADASKVISESVNEQQRALESSLDKAEREQQRIFGTLNTELGRVVNQLKDGQSEHFNVLTQWGRNLDHKLVGRDTTHDAVERALAAVEAQRGEHDPTWEPSTRDLSAIAKDIEAQLRRQDQRARMIQGGADLIMGGTPGKAINDLIGKFTGMIQFGPFGGIAGLMLQSRNYEDKFRAQANQVSHQFAQAGGGDPEAGARAMQESIRAGHVGGFFGLDYFKAVGAALARAGETDPKIMTASWDPVGFAKVGAEMKIGGTGAGGGLGGIGETLMRLDSAAQAAAGTFANFATQLVSDVGAGIKDATERMVEMSSAAKAMSVSANVMVQGIMAGTSALRVMGDHSDSVKGWITGYTGRLASDRGIENKQALGIAIRSVQDALGVFTGMDDSWAAYFGQRMGMGATNNPMGIMAHFRTGGSNLNPEAKAQFMGGLLGELHTVIKGINPDLSDVGTSAGLISQMWGTSVEGGFALAEILKGLGDGGPSSEAVNKMTEELQKEEGRQKAHLTVAERTSRLVEALLMTVGGRLMDEIVGGFRGISDFLDLHFKFSKPAGMDDDTFDAIKRRQIASRQRDMQNSRRTTDERMHQTFKDAPELLKNFMLGSLVDDDFMSHATLYERGKYFNNIYKSIPTQATQFASELAGGGGGAFTQFAQLMNLADTRPGFWQLGGWANVNSTKHLERFLLDSNISIDPGSRKALEFIAEQARDRNTSPYNIITKLRSDSADPELVAAFKVAMQDVAVSILQQSHQDARMGNGAGVNHASTSGGPP